MRPELIERELDQLLTPQSGGQERENDGSIPPGTGIGPHGCFGSQVCPSASFQTIEGEETVTEVFEGLDLLVGQRAWF